MAVVTSNLTSGTETSSGPWSTASVSPTSNALVLLAVSIRNGASTNPGTPSVSGNSLTWVLINSIVYDSTSGSRRAVFLFRAMGASPSSGAITITPAETDTDAAWVVDESTGVDTSGTNGSGAIVQSVTNKDESGTVSSLTVTLAAFGSTNNATYGTFGIGANTGTFTAGSGFSITAQETILNGVGIASEWKATNDTSVDISFSANEFFGGIAIEIRSAVSATAIAFGASTNSGVIAATNTTTFDSPSVFGVNQIGWVAMFARDATLADTEASSVTWNGSSMTKAATQKYDTATPYLGVSLWYIFDPADGVTSIVATWTGTIDTGGAIASFFTGAKQSGVPDASGGAQDVSASATDPTKAITTIADNAWVIDCVYDKISPTITVGSGQTQIAQLAPNAGGDSAASSYEGPKTPAGSVTMSWTAGDDDWAIIVASFAPAAAATTVKDLIGGFGVIPFPR